MFTSSLYTLLVAAATATSVAAHAHEAPRNWKRDNAIARDALETRCGSQLSARRAKRSAQMLESAIRKRSMKRGVQSMPRQTASNDSTCLVTPEVTQGPYHILGEIVRQNMTEDQLGIPLEVSIDFVDIETCEPVQVWVDAWHANATGYYAGYIAETGLRASTSSPGGGGAPGDGASMSGMPSGSMSGPPAAGSTNTATYDAYSGADSASSAIGDTAMDDQSTFLRGVWRSDEDGHATIYSVVPGWYTGRAQHYHIKVYPEGHIAENGTFVVDGSAVHTGQFFFDNATLTAVAATYPYTENAIAWEDRTNNEVDSWYPYQAATGYNAEMDITWIGSEITDGLIGSIAVGLNMSYASPELSKQYAAFDYSSYLAASMLPSASATA